MVQFNQDHKKELNSFMEEGVHQVKIMTAALGESGEGSAAKEYMEFTVVDDQEREDKVRLWFTTDKAINYSFSTIRTIFVHNAAEAKKDAVRKQFDALENTKELEEACNKVLIGAKCWMTIYKDENRTYQNDAGETKHSYSRNIYGYEPKPRTVGPTTETATTETTPKADDNNIAGF